MGRAGEHFGFFRVRTPLTTEWAPGGVLWMAQAVRYIDFSYEVLLVEASAIGMMTNGGVDYDQCKALPFDLYEYLITKVPKRLSELMRGKNG